MLFAVALLVVTALATFFLSDDDSLLGHFCRSRQLLWTSRVHEKGTLALVFFSLLSAVLVPLLALLGLRELFARRDAKPLPPEWRETAFAHQSRAETQLLRVTLVWLVLAAPMRFWPETLTPFGLLAALLLYALPVLPLFIVFLGLEVIGRPTYVEGPIEFLEVVEDEHGHRQARLTLEGREFLSTPEVVAGLSPGVVVRLLAGSSQRTVLRLDRRASGA
jgi:hypothetical protein